MNNPSIIIKDSCKCGAKFNIISTYNADAKSQHDKWLEAHKACREKKGIFR